MQKLYKQLTAYSSQRTGLNILFLIFFLFAIACSLLPGSAHAQVPIGSTYGSFQNLTDVNKLTGSLISNATIIGGVVFLVLIVVAGYTMLSESGNSEKFAQGRTIITYALIGFLLIFAAYWIIQIVEAITKLRIIS